MKILKESGLSRVFFHMERHDTGTITAFRSKYSLKENLERNRNLLAKILSKGYNVTEVNGIYVEDYNTPDAKEVKEKTFFVVDVKDKGNLEKDLRSWGETFEQDSILFVPRPGETSVLWGTNHTAEFPGFGKKVDFTHRKLGSSGEFMARVKGRPFIFESFSRDIASPDGHLGRWATKVIADKF